MAILDFYDNPGNEPAFFPGTKMYLAGHVLFFFCFLFFLCPPGFQE